MTTRREQVCEATAQHRKRRKHGLFWRPINVTKDQLDQLEVRGYLDPDRRGDYLVHVAMTVPPCFADHLFSPLGMTV